MANPLNLLPARVPIGRATGADGRTVDVLMTPEFARAWADFLARVGGANGIGSDDLATLAELASIAPSDCQALRAEVDELRSTVEQLAPALALQRQIDTMRVELALIEDPAAMVRYVLANFAPILSPHFKGIPTAPTAALDTDTDQLATCKFVLNQAGDVAPLMNGALPAPGGSERYARADHVHPSDSSKQGAIAAATVTGSRAGNAALTSLLAGLAGQGLIINSTTA